VDTHAGSVTLDDGEVLQADRVVVAAGPWTSDLGGIDAPPLTPSRQVVVDLRPPPDLRATWARGPAFLVQPAYGVPPRDELPLKVGDHAFSLAGHPDDPRDPSDDEVASVMEVAGEALVDLDRYELLAARVCYYTFHDEERFVVEPRGDRGALLAGFSGHGFKFGAVVGKRVAAALDEDADWSEVTAWAAGRVPTS
jgi:glycine/D-amino acid oxidase-like deaminating enzyme